MPYPPGYRHPETRRGEPWVEQTWLPGLERPFVERTEPIPSPWTFHCDPEILAAAQLQSVERQLNVIRNRHIPKTSLTTSYGRGKQITKEVKMIPGCIPGTSIPLSRLNEPQGVKKDGPTRIPTTGRGARFMNCDNYEPAPFNFTKQSGWAPCSSSLLDAEIQRQIRESGDNRDFSNRGIKMHWENRLKKLKEPPPTIEYYNDDGSSVIIPAPLGAKAPSVSKDQASTSKVSSTPDMSAIHPEFSQACGTASVEPAAASRVDSGTGIQDPALALPSSHQGCQKKMAVHWDNPFVCPALDNEKEWPKLS